MKKSEMETQKTEQQKDKRQPNPLTEGKRICMFKRKKYETSD